MAQVQRRIVHKQFNSPIALYSNTNVKETLDRELKTLNNGAVGIDFDDPSTTRAGALAKSAVLAALEEEEREKAGHKPGLKRVAWPPPNEGSLAEPVEPQQPNQQPPQYQAISQQQSQPVYTQQVPQQTVHSPAPQPNYAPVVQKQPPKAQQQRPVSIHSFSSLQNQAPSTKPLSPLPLLQTSPQFHTPVYGSPRGWAHVDSPRSPGAINQQPKTFYNTAPTVTPPFEMTNSTSSYEQPQYQPNVAAQQQSFAPQASYGQQPNYEQQQVHQQAYEQQQVYQQHAYEQQQAHLQDQQAHLQQQHYAQQPVHAHQPVTQQLPYQGNPLRKEAPVTQKPAPVYASQPVASSFQGGAHRRGDLRWPPTEYKQQAELENEARRRVALGPAFRPKRVNKDYSQFFAQNALSGTYPGYRVPPGTTHVNE